MVPNYALKGTLRTSREFPGYDVGAGPLNAALGTPDQAMSRVMTRSATAVLLAIVGGAALAFASIPLLGFTVRIVAPANLCAWLNAHGLFSLGYCLWDTFILFGLGIGIGLAALLVVLWRLSPGTCISSGALTIATLVATLYLAVPPFLHGNLAWLVSGRPWSNLSLGLSVLLAAASAFMASRRGVPN